MVRGKEAWSVTPPEMGAQDTRVEVGTIGSRIPSHVRGTCSVNRGYTGKEFNRENLEVLTR